MKAFIFDLDGTLIDSLADIAAACNATLKAHNLPVHPLAAYRHMVGNGFTTLVRRALPEDSEFSAAQIDGLVDEARKWYAVHMTDMTKPYPGMTTVLQSLACQKVKLAVLSNKPDSLSVELINHFFPDIPFTHVRGAVPDMPLKPNPEALIRILLELDIKKTCCAYVGDSDVDIITAHNAGLTGIGAAWGFRGEHELKQAGADRIAQVPLDLVEFAAALSS